MDERQFQSRLSQIVTQWTVLHHAQGKGKQDAGGAQEALLERYQGAIYRYLVASLRDPDAADEVFQDFALRFVRGDFQNADPQRGKFRAFLKTVLSRMVIDYHRRKRRSQRLGGSNSDLVEEISMDAAEAEFEPSWKTELVNRALAGLQEMESQSGQPYHTVLSMQMNQPKVNSRSIADALNAQLKPRRPFTDTGVRKILQRARDRYAELLLREVQSSVATSELDILEEELGELGLLPYCKPLIDRRRRR